jgi:hypothetical protein
VALVHQHLGGHRGVVGQPAVALRAGVAQPVQRFVEDAVSHAFTLRLEPGSKSNKGLHNFFA